MALSSSTEVLGARLLKEIRVEEGSLEDILKELRIQHTPVPARIGIKELDALWAKHGVKLSITGRALPLLYHIIDSWVSKRNGTVAVLDLEGRFSPSHLTCELQHVHIWRVTKNNLNVTLEGVEEYMLWGEHWSKGREWVGTIVIGGVGGDVMSGWSGWLRVEREETATFAIGSSVEEVLAERERRQEVVEGSGWRAACESGEYVWEESSS